MMDTVAILRNHENYNLKNPAVGFVSASLTFNPSLKLLSFGNGAWLEVKARDLVYITLSDYQIKQIFPLYQ